MNLGQLTKEELEKQLNRLREELAEIEEESLFVMGQTGIHLPGATVKRYEAEKISLRDKIKAVEEALEKMSDDLR